MRNRMLIILLLLLVAIAIIIGINRSSTPGGSTTGGTTTGGTTTPASPIVPTGIQAFDDAVNDYFDRTFYGQSGSWSSQPAVLPRPSTLTSPAGLQVLLDTVINNTKPPGLSLDQLTPAQLQVRQLQGTALAFLADNPSASTAATISQLLTDDKIWDPWRAALVLAATHDSNYFNQIKDVLDAQPYGWAGGQAALALGELGDPRGVNLLVDFMDQRYGSREENLAYSALLNLASAGGASVTAVIDGAFQLVTHQPSGTRTTAGVTWQLDHPERVAYIRMSGLAILNAIGRSAEATRLTSLLPGLALSADDLAYAQQTIALMSTR